MGGFPKTGAQTPPIPEKQDRFSSSFSTTRRLEPATGQILMLRPVLSTKKRLAKTLSQARPWGFVIAEVPIKGVLAQRVKRLPAVQETHVRSLGREDPLEKEMVTQSGTLAWKIPWTKKPGWLQSMGSQRVGHNWVTSLSLSFLVHQSLLCPPGVESQLCHYLTVWP